MTAGRTPTAADHPARPQITCLRRVVLSKAKAEERCNQTVTSEPQLAACAADHKDRKHE